MKIHTSNLIKCLISVLMILLLSSCTAMLASRMPKGSVSMQQTYNAALNGNTTDEQNTSLDVVRERLQPVHHRYHNDLRFIRTSGSSINNQFARLPNPNIVMYVYPHTAGNGENQTPIPGYTTVFPLYLQVHYAMPGEMIAY